MQKNIIFLGTLLLSSAAYSQVGINNEAPKATLDVTAKTTDGTKPEGIIAPRLTGDQIKYADTQYDTAQIGTIVYATSAVGTSTQKTINITSAGYYYFDNNLVWVKFGSGSAAPSAEPWYIQNTSTGATANDQNIYQQGKVAVGFTNTDGVSGKQFEVKGDIKTLTIDGTTYSGLETNNSSFGLPINMMFSADTPNIISATKSASVSTSINDVALNAQGANGTSSVGATIIPTLGPKSEMLTSNSVTNIVNSIVLGSNGATEQVDKIILRSENTPVSTATRVLVDKAEGVTFKYGGIANPSGNYTFPQNNGTAGQVLVTNGAVPALMTGAQLEWKNVSDLIQNNDWHITGNTGTTAGTNFLGTTDANALMFKVNGQQSGYISDNATNTVGATGLYKTTLGYQAGMGTTGDRVTAIGSLALSQNTAQNNTAIGAFALQKNITGQNNMAVGDQTLLNNNSRRNTAIGSTALNNNTTGEGNTAIGYRANASNVAGSFNTFIGSQAGEGTVGTGVIDATASIAIGRGTTMANGLNNATVIGAYGTVTQSNSIVLGTLAGTYNTGTSTVTLPQTNVGIGTTAPSNALHIVATNPARLEGLQTGTAIDNIVVAGTTGADTGVLRTVTAASLAVEPWQNQSDATKATSNLAAIYQTGNVSIGSQTSIAPFTSNSVTITPKLSITGDVAATGSYYTTTGKYADYVFEDYYDGASKIYGDYKFKSLAETAAYIKENKHLPGVTSIKDVLKTENGYTVNLSELSIQQLEKIEELYLHTIEQQEEISKQKTEINDLKSRMEKLEQLLLKASNNK